MCPCMFALKYLSYLLVCVLINVDFKMGQTVRSSDKFTGDANTEVQVTVLKKNDREIKSSC